MPDHAPDALQLVALVDDQVSWELPFEVTEDGDADRESVGAGIAVFVTATVIVFDLEPADTTEQVSP
jgi:hypothetical protein